MQTATQPTTRTQAAPAKAFVTVNQLADMPEMPFTVGAIRMQIARAEQNGLAPHIRRVGRRVLIDLPGYIAWIEGGGA